MAVRCVLEGFVVGGDVCSVVKRRVFDVELSIWMGLYLGWRGSLLR